MDEASARGVTSRSTPVGVIPATRRLAMREEWRVDGEVRERGAGAVEAGLDRGDGRARAAWEELSNVASLARSLLERRVSGESSGTACSVCGCNGAGVVSFLALVVGVLLRGPDVCLRVVGRGEACICARLRVRGVSGASACPDG